MTGTAIGEDQFTRLVTSMMAERVHFECQPVYAVDDEAGGLDDWLAANRAGRPPTTPDQIGWWNDYLAWARETTAPPPEGRGVRLVRIRIVDDPPTDYQRWAAWSAPWYAAAGEQLLYLTRAEAVRVGLPARRGARDWHLLDGAQVIVTSFTPAGVVAGSTLITDPVTAALYRRWRDRALAVATPVAA